MESHQNQFKQWLDEERIKNKCPNKTNDEIDPMTGEPFKKGKETAQKEIIEIDFQDCIYYVYKAGPDFFHISCSLDLDPKRYNPVTKEKDVQKLKDITDTIYRICDAYDCSFKIIFYGQQFGGVRLKYRIFEHNLSKSMFLKYLETLHSCFCRVAGGLEVLV